MVGVGTGLGPERPFDRTTAKLPLITTRWLAVQTALSKRTVPAY